jgi:hypothetical protein
MKSLSNSVDIEADTGNIRNLRTDSIVSLNSLGQNDILVSGNLIPSSDNTYKLGNTVRWNQLNTVRSYIPQNDTGSNGSGANVPAVLGNSLPYLNPTSWIWTNIPLTFDNPVYNDDGLVFKTPANGYYVLTIYVRMDVEIGFDSIRFALKAENINQYQQVFHKNTDSGIDTTITFTFLAANHLVDRFKIVAAGTVSITNVQILQARIACCSNYTG